MSFLIKFKPFTRVDAFLFIAKQTSTWVNDFFFIKNKAFTAVDEPTLLPVKASTRVESMSGNMGSLYLRDFQAIGMTFLLSTATNSPSSFQIRSLPIHVDFTASAKSLYLTNTQLS